MAGYTLDELFHLSRSKFNQQRVLALQVISNILAKCHQGDYYEIIKAGTYTNKNEPGDDELEKNENDKHNLLNQLIDRGVLYLLRWSLDDQTESIINVSLNGLKNILQPLDQENILDASFYLLRGHEAQSFYPYIARHIPFFYKHLFIYIKLLLLLNNILIYCAPIYTN